MAETLLKLKDINVHFGGVKSLSGISLDLDEGEMVLLLGPNGAGKSTILKALFGLAPIDSGQVLWHEKAFLPRSHEVVSRGLAFVPQGRRVFPSLTVLENLEIMQLIIRDRHILKQRIEEVFALFPVLRAKQKNKAGNLSGGEQQMVALARGLMTDPKVLLLDEPSLGLSPKLVKEVFEKVKEINEKRKTAILVVEHNIRTLLDIVKRVYVLDKGKVVTTGEPKKIISSGILERVFMGKTA